MDGDAFDQVVLGAGLRGLGAALRLLREEPGQRLLVVEAMPQPGGAVRTQRSNGFCCELGPFAFARADVAPLLALLQRPPAIVEPLPGTHEGWVFTGTGLRPVAVDPTPISFPTGCEELVQACRRELGSHLRLGRTATAARPGGAGWEVELGGEAPAKLVTRRLTVALPTAAAASLLADLDRSLPAAADRLRRAPRAFAFLGGHASSAPELRGHGIVPADGLATQVAEVVFCTQVFAGRALPGRFLVRCEVDGPALAGGDPGVLGIAEGELRRWTGLRAPIEFTKLHRFEIPVEDAASVECRVRLRGLAARAPGLTVL